MALFNTVYSNVVLEAKINDILNTKLNTRNFMTIDNSLAEAPGMIKKINKYKYEGKVENVEEGQGNSTYGKVTFEPVQYEVAVAQHSFKYSDEEYMTDNNVLPVGLQGGATVMVNDMNTKYFAELAKASLKATWASSEKISYDTVVDAIGKMNIEDETGLFLIIGNDLKADLRKDPDFKSARMGEILFNGQIGDICGVPVIVSKLTPAGKAYLATKEAVTLFTKKDSEVEQERDAEKRINKIIMRKVNLVALTDATKVVELSQAA